MFSYLTGGSLTVELNFATDGEAICGGAALLPVVQSFSDSKVSSNCFAKELFTAFFHGKDISDFFNALTASVALLVTSNFFHPFFLVSPALKPFINI